MSYNKYPKEMKEAIMVRMLEGDETVTDIQRDTGVGINTLYRWRDQAKHQKGLSATTKYKNADKWSSQDKFMVVLETANLTEIEFSDLYSRKIVGWEVWKSEDAKHASEFQKDGQEKPDTGVFQKKNG